MDEKLTEKALQAIEDCGAAEMPIPETLEIAEVSLQAWKTCPEAPRRYKIGQLKTKLAIRQAIVKGAKAGNPALLKAYMDFTAEERCAENERKLGEMPAAEGFHDQKTGEFDDI